MKWRPLLRALIVAIPLLALGAFAADWGIQRETHSTPEKAQHLADPTVGPFERVKFANGTVLFTPGVQGNFFTAWYMTRNLWGWHVAEISEGDPSYRDIQSVIADGETLFWGTNMPTSITKIEYHHDGKIYSTRVNQSLVWYLVVPFHQTVIPNSAWTATRGDGKTVPFY